MKKNERPKTLGPRTATVLAELYQRGRTIFAVADVRDVAALGAKPASNLIANMIARGHVTRLKSGLFILVPFEMGHAPGYIGDPYLVARELADTNEYCLSHVSAMDIHRMLPPRPFVVYVTTPLPRHSRNILGTEFRFVRCKKAHVFGIVDHWLTKTEKIQVSDLERTVIDGLKQPEHCGGITQVAKGLYIRRDDVEPDRLVEYALRLDVGAVTRRLGFLMELFEVGGDTELARLHRHVTSHYARLDPVLPTEGRFASKWRLQLNVSPDELEAIMRT